MCVLCGRECGIFQNDSLSRDQIPILKFHWFVIFIKVCKLCLYLFFNVLEWLKELDILYIYKFNLLNIQKLFKHLVGFCFLGS